MRRSPAELSTENPLFEKAVAKALEQLKQDGHGLHDPHEPIKPEAAAQYLKTTEANLARLRFEGKGPRYHRLNRSIRYTYADLAAYVDDNVVQAGA